jgi:PAS domain S-box-containing protein
MVLQYGTPAAALSNLASNFFSMLPFNALNLSGSELLLCIVLILGVLVIGTYRAWVLQRQRQVEADYQCLLNTANEGIWTVDVEGRTTYLNQRLAEMLGYTVEQMLGRPVFDFMDEGVRLEAQQHFECCQQGIKEQSISFRRQDGEALSCIISTSPRLNQRGTFIGTLILLSDVTERKQAQEERQSLQAQLEQQVQTMDTILSASPDHFYMFDREGRFIYASRAALQALGLHKSDIVGKTEQELGFPPEVIEPHKQRREIVFATGQALRGETNLQTGDGVRQYEYILTPIHDASGSVQVVVVTATDVTERRQEEEELRQYRNHLEQLVAARTAELARKIEQLNQEIIERKQAEQELQRQTQYRQLLAEITFRIRESLQIEVILQTMVTQLQQLLQADRVLFYRLLPNRNGKVVAEAVVPGWQKTLGQEFIDHCFEDEYLKQYQQEIHAWSDVEQAGFQPCHLDMLRQFSIRANLIVPILLKDKIWGMLFVQQCSAPRQWNQFEIDLLRQLADQLSIALAQAQLLEQATRHSQELARSNAELEQFAYAASHDLKEPLRTLASYAKLLSRRYSSQVDDKGNRFIQYITEEALRMQAMIDDLLQYSRVGRQPQNFTSVRCSAVFDIVVTRLEGAISSSGATVTRGDLPVIMADETQLVQLFQNLISNAIKYRSKEPPAVHVAAQRQEGQWLFWVRDNGIGLAPKYAERIFAIFQRLHLQEEYSGTGIGLAIAAKIVERHGGRIWVESELGKGATFYFTIPDRDVSPLLPT